MAAADPHHRWNQRLEDADRLLMVAFRECADAKAKPDGGGARGQSAVGCTRFHFRKSCFQNRAAGCRRSQRVMDIGKMRPRPREEMVAIGGHFAPIGLQTGLAGQREPPQQRRGIGKNVQWWIAGIRRREVLLVDSERAVEIAGFERGEGGVPAKMCVQEA